MPQVKVILWGHTAGAEAVLYGEQPTPADAVDVNQLQLVVAGHTQDFTLVGSPFRIDNELLNPTTAGVYKLKRHATKELVVKAQWLFAAGAGQYFGVKFDAGASIILELHVAIIGADMQDPYLVLCATGRIEANAAGPVYAGARVGYCVRIDDLPTGDVLPSLMIHPPELLPWPKLTIPWPSFPRLPSFTDGIKLPAVAFDVPGVPIRFGVELIEISIDATGKVVVRLHRIRIEGIGGLLQGSITFEWSPSGAVTISQVQFDGLPTLNGLKVVSLADGCFGFDGNIAGVSNLLKLFGHDLLDDPNAPAGDFQLRIHADAGEVDEIRLDWAFAADRKLPLPGITLEAAAPDMLTLLFRRTAAEDRETRLTFVATFPQNKGLKAYTTFTWPDEGGDRNRELLPDANQNGPQGRLIEVTATAAKPLSVAVFDFPTRGGSNSPPRYFQALQTPLSPLLLQETAVGIEDPENPATPDVFDFVRGAFDGCPISEVVLEPLTFQIQDPTGGTHGPPDRDVDLDFKVNVANPFEFPFLNFPSIEGNQFIQISDFRKVVDPNSLKYGAALDLMVQIGDDLHAKTTITLTFDLTRMAFSLDSTAFKKGIPFLLDGKKEGDFLGLKWEFQGLEKKDDVLGLEAKTAFILAIDGRAFSLRKAPGAKFFVKYDKATRPDEPILFNVDEFALTPKGLDLTATISDKPARLNGLETRFRFTEGVLQIKENRVAGFTIAGTGPLPPDLVGDAVADIAMQFAQIDGKVRLIRGSARIRGPKLLSCKATRFEFELDGIGLEFVHEGGADHLYFTLSGKARYKLAAGDNASGPLAWLPGIEIQLVDCPLTGNARVIAKHVRFLIELPKPISFNLMGCFKMELRAIGFVPQFDRFGDDTAAMQLSGQIKFGDIGDVIDAKIDFHDLFVARPAPGRLIPRLYLKQLGVRIAQGDTFCLEAVVDFFSADAGDEIEPGIKADGFAGEGTVTIKGLPPIAATTAFLRVSPDSITWKRAWFLYLEARQLSFRIPVVEIYLREIGFGFGYRYTLASFKAADEITDVRLLLKRLKELSLTQGNLSSRKQWRVDLEGPGEDARWTVAFRALLAASSAQVSPFTGYDVEKERELACLYVMDAVIAVRSDLTFFIAARGWLNTNYNDFAESVRNKGTLHSNPLLSGFAMLSVKQSRFLANLSSNPSAEYGDHPPLPSFFKRAVRQSRFSATLLIEPGLVHYELGWPNQLSWSDSLGPLTAEFRGGAIFRLSRSELVVGNSFLARGKLKLSAEFNAGFFGAELTALADVSYGARYIGVLDFADPLNGSVFYGAVGIDIRVTVYVHFWLHLDFKFYEINIDLHVSFDLQFTAALQVAVPVPPKLPGAIGTATLCVSVAGRNCNFSVRVGINDGMVEFARGRTERFLKMGLEAEDVEPIPGTTRSTLSGPGPVASPLGMVAPTPVAAAAAGPTPVVVTPGGGAPVAAGPVVTAAAAAATPGEFFVANYNLVMAPGRYEHRNGAVTLEDAAYFLLVPQSPRSSSDSDGFYPVPPNMGTTTPTRDFAWTLVQDPLVDFAHFQPAHFDPAHSQVGDFKRHTDFTTPYTWQVDWNFALSASPQDSSQAQKNTTLGGFLRYSYVYTKTSEAIGDVVPQSDPSTSWVPSSDPAARRSDHRVDSPTNAAYESAARGAAEQFAGPHFKFDPNSEYDRALREACAAGTSVYTADGKIDSQDQNAPTADQASVELRSSLIQAIVRDFLEFVEASKMGNTNAQAALQRNSLTFRLGLVLRVTGAGTTASERRTNLGRFLDKTNTNGASPFGELAQRFKLSDNEALSTPVPVKLFNPPRCSFLTRPANFNHVRVYAHEDLIVINWRLGYPDLGESLGDPMDDPEQQLRHYVISREHIDGDDPPLVVTVKAGDVLHKEQKDGGQDFHVVRLRPRFQFSDQFRGQEGEGIAPLTAAGKTYLYTVTPIDLAGNASPQSLTVVATRFPAAPPLVPADGELTVAYVIPEDLGKEIDISDEPFIGHIDGDELELRFSDPIEPPNQTFIPVNQYHVVFRREATLPVGFYGADEDVRGGQGRGMAVTNARVRRTDIVISFPPPIDNGTSGDRAESGRKIRILKIPVAKLEEYGVIAPLSTGKRAWRPEGWRVFIQTESESGGGRPQGVRSSLAPVVVRLRFRRGVRSGSALTVDKSQFEERQAGLLEWVPNPVRINLLGPTDCDGEVGFAKVPMPQLPPADELDDTTKVNAAIKSWRLDDSGTGDGLGSLRFEQHPARMRAVKVRWNQGPSDNPRHPLSLHARYQVYEFDVFSNPGDVLTPAGVGEVDFREWAARANLRLVQEVDLVPASDLPKLPKNAGDPLMWEAWYPSAARRLLIKRQQIARVEGILKDNGPHWPAGTNVREVPWYSWSESFLEWIDPRELVSVQTSGNEDVVVKRNAAFHPFLLDVGSLIGMADANADADPFPALFAEAGPQPSRGSDVPRDNVTDEGNVSLASKPGKLDLFLKGTAPDADPFGWGVLQRMGLAMGLRVRTGKPIEKGSLIPFGSGSKYSRDYPVGEYILGHDLLALLHGALELQKTRHQKTVTPKDGMVTLQAPAGTETFYRLSDDITAPVSRLAPKAEVKINGLSNAPLMLTYWGGEPTVALGISGAPQSAEINVNRHLHVEYLFQPGKRIRIATDEEDHAGPADPEEMLALVQLSLRPAVKQLLRYRRFSLDGLEAGIPVQVTFSQTGPFAVVLQQTGVLSGIPAPLTDPTTIAYTMPASGPLNLIARLKDAGGLKFKLKFGSKFDSLSTIENPEGTGVLIKANPSTNITVSLHFEAPSAGAWYRVWEGGTGTKTLIADGTQDVSFVVATDANGNLQIELFNVPDSARNAKAEDAGNNAKAVKVLWSVRHDYVSPTDWPAANFPFQENAPWASNGTSEADDPHGAWTRFRRYVRVADPTIGHADMNPAPAPENDVGKRNLAALLAWQNRFFLHGGDITPNDGSAVVSTAPHHWIASGYPRAASPMPLTPDSAGRITGFRPIEDLWAHAYRYYIRPRGRYELLWEDLGRSHHLVNDALIGELETRQKTLLLPEPGGADVALGRIRPLAAPLVLSSRRLDAPTTPGVAAVPGKVWEVLVVKHTEQDLIERNRSLVNHLEFRQTSQAIVRRFDPQESRLPDLQRAFAAALSPIYANSAADIAPGVAKLKLFFRNGAPVEIDLAGGRTLAQVETEINLKKATTKLVAKIRPVIDGTLTNGVQLVIKPDPDLLEFEPNVHIRLATDETTPRQLVTQPINLSGEIILAPVSDPTEPARLPTVPAQPDHVDWKDLGDNAPSLDLPYRSTQFSQGLTAIQYQRLPFYYTHRLLLIAQTAHVVSPITVVDQKDFEYVTPEVEGTLEGVAGADGKRYRKIVFALGRFWDALTPEAQTEWALENPQTATNDVRRPSSLIDSSMTYTIVISRGESGNVEAIAEYRFNPSESTGFESRTLPVPFRGEAVALTQDPANADPLRDPFNLETILLSLGDGAWFEEVVQIVSSRIAFSGANAELRRWPAAKQNPALDDLMFPRTAALRWHFGPDVQGNDPVQEFTAAEADALRQLAAKCDISYGEPLLRLLTAVSVRRIEQIGFERSVEACVGLEQLQEIHDSVKIEPEFSGGPFTPGSGKVTWTGFVTAPQMLVLEEWGRTSLFGETFNALRILLRDHEVFSDDLTAGTVTAALLTTHQLDLRISIVPVTGGERLQWKAALTRPPATAELTNLNNLRNALPPAEQAAVQALIDRVGALGTVEIDVRVVESHWRPRPTQKSTAVDAALRDRLLFGNGVVGFTGLMTLQEGRTVRDLAGLTVPNKASVITLFTRAANGGLGGGTLKLVVRRGSALPFSSALLGKLDFT